MSANYKNTQDPYYGGNTNITMAPTTVQPMRA